MKNTNSRANYSVDLKKKKKIPLKNLFLFSMDYGPAAILVEHSYSRTV